MGLFDMTADNSLPSTGLLGNGWNDPQSAAVMAIASGLIQGNLGAGFDNANQAYQGVATANLQRADMAQQIGLRNIQLQQQMQRFKWLQDAISGVDGPQTQAAPDQNAPQIALGQGADMQPSLGLPDGSKLNTGGVGPTNANAARMGTVAPVQVPVQSSNPYVAAGQALGMTPRQAVVQSMLFPDAFNKAYGAAITPTDPTRMAIAAGQDPHQANAAMLFKNTYLPPTRLGNGAYNDPRLGVQGLPGAAPIGFMNQKDPASGQWSIVKIPGGPEATAASAEASAGGKAKGGAPYATPTTVQLSDNRTLMLTAPELAAFNTNGGILPARYASLQGLVPPQSTAPAPASSGAPAPTVAAPAAPAASAPGNVDRVAIMKSELAKQQDQLANWQQYMSPNERMQDPQGAQFRQRAQNNIAGIQRELQGLGAPAPQAASPTGSQPPVIGLSAPAGFNAAQTASQGAPSEQMRSDYGSMANAGPQVQQSLEYLDHMIELAKNKPAYMGMGIGGAPGVTAISADAAKYEKARASYISAQGKGLGAAGTDAARATIDSSVPDYGKPQAAMISGLTDQRNQLVLNTMRRALLAPIYQTGNEKQYTQTANGFDQNIKPSMVPVLGLAGDARRAAISAQIKANPSLRPSYEWAFNHGLVQ